MDWYADFFKRHRKIVFLFVFLMTVLAASGMSRLRYNDDPHSLFQGDDGDYVNLVGFFRDFGPENNDLVLVLEAEDWFTPNSVGVLYRITSEIRFLSDVQTVLSPCSVFDLDNQGVYNSIFPIPEASEAEFARARIRACQHPLVGGWLLSPDGTTLLVIVRLAGTASSVADIRPVVQRINDIAHRYSNLDGFRVRATGIPAARLDVYSIIQREGRIFSICGILLCTGIAWFLFRNFNAVFASVLGPMIGLIWTLGFVGWTGYGIGVLSSILPLLVMIIGFTDSVHLTFDMRASRETRAHPLTSATAAIKSLGPPCALTSLTTAVSFGSLAWGNVGMVRQLGQLCAPSIVLIFLAVITTTPLVTSAMRNIGGNMVGKNRARAHYSDILGNFIDRLTRNAVPTVIVGVVLTLTCFVASAHLNPENRLSDTWPRYGESFQAMLHVEKAFGRILPMYVMIEWQDPLTADSEELYSTIDETVTFLRQASPLIKPLSVLDIFSSLPADTTSQISILQHIPNELVKRLIRPDKRKAVIILNLPNISANIMLPLLATIRAGLDEIMRRNPGILMSLTGTDVVARKQLSRMISDFIRSLLISILIISGSIVIAFRSMKLGLVSLLPNLFPLALVGALLAVTGRSLQIVSAAFFVILLGLAVDDTIHFLARHRREYTVDPLGAIRRTFFKVGKPILFTTVVLVSGTALLLLSSVSSVKLIAVGLCIGLVGALIGDLIVLPALIALVFREKGKRVA
jgi:predicted RND superfamily exporter protein